MAFSDQAIGFYLQMEDQMTPKFPGVTSAYQKFVRKMTGLNEKLYGSTAGAATHLGNLVKGLTKISKVATMTIDMQLTPKARKSMSKLVTDAVIEALLGAKIRLRAAMPSKVSKLFAQDVGLRQLYKDMPQPPDMLGKIERFAEGGKVPEGKGRRGKDSVLSLLTPGEVVIPTKLVKKLERAFADVEKRKGVIEAGFGSKEDVAYYETALVKIANAMEALADATKNAGIESKTRLTPQIVNLRERFTALTKAEEKASDEADHFLGKVLGPARFVALMTSLRGVQDGFSQLSGGVQQFGNDVGAGDFQSFPDRLREIRQRLGLTADESARFTGAIAESSKAVGTNFFKALEATDALIGAGEKDRNKLIEQSSILARANRVTGADFDSLAKSIRLFTGDLGMSSKNFDAIVLSIDKMTKSSDLAVNTPELMDALATALNNPILKGKGAEDIQNYANNLLALRAASESVWQGESGIEQIFADALAGNDEALTRVSKLTSGQISNTNELQDALMSRGGLTGAFDLLLTQIDQLRENGDTVGLEKIGQDMGLDGKFLTRLQDFIGKQGVSSRLSVPIEESATAGDKLSVSMDKMTTAAEKLSNVVGNFVGSSGPMQMLVEFLDQVPVLALIAGAHLSGSLLRSFGVLGKGMLGVVGSVFGGFGRLFGSGMLGKMFGGLGKVFGFGKGGASAGSDMLSSVGGGAVAGPGLMAASAKIALILAAVAAILLVVGTYADDILPLLETALPGLAKIGKLVASEAGIAVADTLVDLVKIFEPLGKMEKNFEEAGKGLKAAAGFLFFVGLAGVELIALSSGAMVVDGLIKIVEVVSGGTPGTTNPLQLLAAQGQSIASTLSSLAVSFAPIAPLASTFENAGEGLWQAAKFLVKFGAVGVELAVLGTGAMIADGISKVIGLFGGQGPMALLQEQASGMVDTLLYLTHDLQRLAPISERIPKLQVGLDGSAKFMTALKPLLDQTAELGDAASRLGDGWFTSGPLSNLRTQAEPMIDTITDLTTWFTRVPINQKAIAGVDFARVFFSKLALTVGAMQQVGAVDADSIRRAAGALLDVRLSQPSGASVSKEQIDQIMQVVVQAGGANPLRDDVKQTNELLKQLIAAVQASGMSTGSLPQRVTAPTTRVLSGMVEDMTNMRH